MIKLRYQLIKNIKLNDKKYKIILNNDIKWYFNINLIFF